MNLPHSIKNPLTSFSKAFPRRTLIAPLEVSLIDFVAIFCHSRNKGMIKVPNEHEIDNTSNLCDRTQI
jgi:hypothetical protein